jgi:hypothetical protein
MYASAVWMSRSEDAVQTLYFAPLFFLFLLCLGAWPFLPSTLSGYSEP